MSAPKRILVWRSVAVVAAVLIGFGLATSAPVRAQDDSLMLTLDQARVIHIARPADTVIIGNPSIADATIRDNQTLIVTARSYGTTNLIVLDRDGQPIADELIVVQSPEESVVTVFKRDARQTFSCAPTCEPVLNVGDQAATFDMIGTQLQTRGTLAKGNN